VNPSVPLVDLAPAAQLLLIATLLAGVPLTWWWLRQRNTGPRARLAALTALTLFLTFDLIVFGAFTRLTDSGLGCPDWPGCYGSASPLGAHAEIHAAQTAMPTGPVTFSKAWIEMIHRYLAMTVGALILVLTAYSWVNRRLLPHSPWWPTLTLVWVIVQGLFGKYTVTLKLYPAIVTLHLIGGLVLLALLVHQQARFRASRLGGDALLRRGLLAGVVVVGLQVALGGWVSTNYAVLACSGFPTCNGQWWPQADFADGFTLLRHLGRDGAGDLLAFPALVAIHLVHRVFALVVTAVLIGLAWRLARAGARVEARVLMALLALQIASGLSNVVLGWPLLAALGHTAGAAALIGWLVHLHARAGSTMVQGQPVRALRPAVI